MRITKNIPQNSVLKLIGNALHIEHQNRAMNDFIAKLFKYFEREEIPVILVKGQGVAQCYERPLWRSCGDVDLITDEGHYDAAKSFLKSKCSSEGIEIKKDFTRIILLNHG